MSLMKASLLESLLSDLDQEQKEAVTTTEGPLLVIAGPGSGKTRVITYRFSYIVLTGKALPSEILCVTFTNKAAGEMKSRIVSLTGSKFASNWWIKTFHSLGLSIVKENYQKLGLKENFVVYDSDDQMRLLKSILKKVSFNELSPEKVLDIISEIRYGYNPSNFFGDSIKELADMYEEELRKNNAVDFTDLIVLPYKLLKKDEEVREMYKNRWKYLMIDEFQDTDPIQYEFIKLILNEHENICVVGDDDQSIYGWRGASVENIRNFDKDFKNCKVVILKTNYRSTDEIISLSNYVASNMMYRRKEKVIRGVGRSDSVPVFIETYDQAMESRIVVEEIENLVSNGYNYNDIAILYRANYLSRILEEDLVRRNIPYRIYSGISFYERIEIKDILAYLKFAINHNDYVSFSRIVNVPRRGVGEVTVNKIIDYSIRNGKDLLQSIEEMMSRGDIKQDLRGFVSSIKALRDDSLSISERVSNLISNIGYYKYLQQTYDNYDERIENVQELLRSIMDFEDSGGKTLEEFINSAALMTNSDEVDEKENCVSLMTLHVSKGLEFPVVFIFGAIDGILPHFKNTHNLSLLDEERRLFYVGITRAKSKLYITSSRYVRVGSMKHSVVSVSRFIDELPSDVIRIRRY